MRDEAIVEALERTSLPQCQPICQNRITGGRGFASGGYKWLYLVWVARENGFVWYFPDWAGEGGAPVGRSRASCRLHCSLGKRGGWREGVCFQ